MKPKRVLEQFEVMTRPLGDDVHEVIGLKCAWCTKVVMGPERARVFYPLFAAHKDPVQGAMATIALQGVDLMLHWLACKAPQGN